MTIEILLPDGTRERHRFTAAWCPALRAWSVPVSRIRDGVGELMARAPEIAGLA